MKQFPKARRILQPLCLFVFLSFLFGKPVCADGASPHFVIASPQSGPCTIVVDTADCKGVARAAHDLATDVGRVFGKAATVSGQWQGGTGAVIVGTIGHSREVDALVSKRRLDVSRVKNQWESYVIDVVDGNLVVAGSDRRGTIYGIYEISKEIGVSPWYWWADVPVQRRDSIVYSRGRQWQPSPQVKYRGIFLNDEAPCLTSWVWNTYGTRYGDHRFYARVFELLLRLKANFMWPAMWGWAFYADDALNSKTADDMGIIIGTSHHEPMCRSQKEWHNHSDNPNVEAQDRASRVAAGGKWDYVTNQKALDEFWAGGVRRNKNTEDIVTIGMRGDGDMAMSEDTNTKLMERIISNQRRIIEKERGKPASQVPQVWALYKEVLDYYDKGMRVPDDVTLLLCDDNWGNVRRVPSPKERKRKGGWGLYYHVDYVGAPRNSKWLNVTSVENMWEQLSLAAENGIDRLWILNVGDLKPMELPISLFMDMAWNMKAYNAGNLNDHLRDFCAQQFGNDQADEAARLLDLQGRYMGRCTPEMLDAHTYSLATGEWQRVVADYQQLERDALRQYASIKPAYHDAYQELVLFPIQAMANLYDLYYSKAMNDSMARVASPEANAWAQRCRADFKRDSLLCANYNHGIAGGKWNGMMTQVHIGYKSWNDNFRHDILPKLTTVTDSTGGNVFQAHDGQVVMEAPHFFAKTDAQHAAWTYVPGLGRTLGGMTLRPTTQAVDGARLDYRFRGLDGVQQVTVWVALKSTLDFLNQGGLRFAVSMDGGDEVVVNFNKNLNEKPENIYSVYYPTVARRVVEQRVTLPVHGGKKTLHTLTLRPLDPGVVFEKVVVDAGGYVPQYLMGTESTRAKGN